MEDDDRQNEMMIDGLDRVGEASQFLGISRSRTYELMDAGQLPFVKIGRSRRIPHRALIDYAARHLCQGGSWAED
jgi:excisionase family DNA binding protein